MQWLLMQMFGLAVMPRWKAARLNERRGLAQGHCRARLQLPGIFQLMVEAQ